MPASETVIKRYTNFGTVYSGCTKPSDFIHLTHSSGAPTGGTDIGFTQGASTFTYRPTIVLTDVEQVYGGIAPHMTNEEASLQFTLVEPSYTNLQQVIQMGTAASSGGYNRIALGGRTDVVSTCVAISMKHTDASKWLIAMLYNGVSFDGLNVALNRGQERRIQTTFRGIVDQDRTAGDQLFQVYED